MGIISAEVTRQASVELTLDDGLVLEYGNDRELSLESISINIFMGADNLVREAITARGSRIDSRGDEVKDSRTWTKIDEFPEVIQSDLIKWRDKLVMELINIKDDK